MLKNVYYLGLFIAIFSIFFFPSLLYAQSTPWSFYNNPLQSNSMDIFYNGVGAANPALRIKTNGDIYMPKNVGIRTTNPAANLTIQQSTDGQGSGGLRSYRTNGTTSLALFQGGDDNTYLGNMGAGGISFLTNSFGTQNMFLATSGNVGIRNTSPQAPLEIGNAGVLNSNGHIRSSTRDGGGGSRSWDFGASYGIFGNYGFNIKDVNMTAPALSVAYNTGNVGIGTINPQGKLAVMFGNEDQFLVTQPGDDQIGIQTLLNGQPLTSYDAWYHKLQLQPTKGLVGIGINPEAKLDILAYGDDNIPVIRMRQSNAPTYGYDMGIDNNVDGGLYFYRNSNGAQEIVMRLRRDYGFVGIRTTSTPVSDLHIKQSANSQSQGGIRLERQDNGGFAQILEGGDQQLYLFTNSNNNYCVVTISNSISCPSDKRLKDNIFPITDSALNKINQLKPSSFILKNTGQSSVGFIAQEVLGVLPEVVNYSESTGYYGISDALLTPYLVKSIQELDVKTSENKTASDLRFQKLEEQVANQQQQIGLLTKEIESLKK